MVLNVFLEADGATFNVGTTVTYTNDTMNTTFVDNWNTPK